MANIQYRYDADGALSGVVCSRMWELDVFPWCANVCPWELSSTGDALSADEFVWEVIPE